MKKNVIKTVVVALTVISMASMMTACKTKKHTDSTNNITYWVPLSSNTSQIATNMANTEFARTLMEKFNCTIEYMHPAQGGEAEKFNILVASGTMPDIVEYKWQSAYQGGPAKALADGIIQELDLSKDAPNLYAYAKKHPEIDNMIKTDDRKYFGYPFIRGDDYLLTSAGLYVRDDWLKELGLDLPETIDDWTNMLRAFKSKATRAPVGAAIVGGISNGAFVTAYGTYDGLYIDEGNVKYGPMEDGYKDFLKQMNSWYKEGIIDSDYASATNNLESDVLNGAVGVGFGACGSGVGKLMAAAPNASFSITGVKNPVLTRGTKAMMGNYQNPVTGRYAVITKDCKNKELCTKLLDYGYSDEGQMLFNFGIEGKSYNIIDGYPTYTENITNNSDGLSMAAAMSNYTLSHTEGPFIQDKRYMEQYAKLPQQKTSLENWLHTDVQKHFMPPTYITMAQQTELMSSIDSITTYVDEMRTKFIMGIEPIENFENFRNELKKRNVEKYIQYNQEAYERYMSR